GVTVGKTPGEGTLPVGIHTVVLRGQDNLGTQPASAPVRLNQLTPLSLALEPLEAELRIEPTPLASTVALNGVAVGRGVWEGRWRAGGHRIEIAEDGFLAARRDIALDRGKRDVLRVVLERDPSSPLWHTESPSSFVFDVSGGLAILPVTG